MTRPSEEARFRAKIVVQQDDCWAWTGYVDRSGYGRFNTADEQRAHRWSYKFHVGPIPDGMVVDHICRNRSCANPQHLRVVTPRENSFAPGSIAPAKLRREALTCKRGHPWDEVNTRWNRGGFRYCQECHLMHGRNSYWRARAAALETDLDKSDLPHRSATES